MQTTNGLIVLELFIADVINYLIPGGAFFIALWLALPEGVIDSFTSNRFAPVPADGAGWILAVVAAYVVGLVMFAISDYLIVPILDGFNNIIHGVTYVNRSRKGRWMRNSLWLLVWPLGITSRYRLHTKESSQPIYSSFKSQMSDYIGSELDGMSYNDLRVLAISVAQPKDAIYRFSFLATMCGATASSLLTVSIFLATLIFLDLLDTPLIPEDVESIRTWWIFPLGLGSLLLMNRRYYFYSITQRIPYFIALVTMAGHREGRTGDDL